MMKALSQQAMALCLLLALTVGTLYAQGSQNVSEIIQQNEDLSQLSQALEQTGLAEALTQGGPYTIFAPSNQAFEGLSDDVRQQLDSTDVLVAVLRQHVVADNVTSAAASNISQAVTVLGDTLDVSAEGEQVQIGNATVTEADLEGSNGVVHIVDQVLIPEQGITYLLDLNEQIRQQQAQGQTQEDNLLIQRDTVQQVVQDTIQQVQRDTMRIQQDTVQQVQQDTVQQVQQDTVQQVVRDTVQQVQQDTVQQVVQDTTMQIQRDTVQMQQDTSGAGSMEQTGQQMEQQMEQTGQQIEQETQQAGQEMEQAAEQAGQEAQQAGQEAQQEMEQMTDSLQTPDYR